MAIAPKMPKDAICHVWYFLPVFVLGLVVTDQKSLNVLYLSVKISHNQSKKVYKIILKNGLQHKKN